MEKLISTISALVIAMPLIIVLLIGVVLALIRWRRHPQVSQLALIAFVVMIAVTLVNRLLTLWLPTIMLELGWTGGEIGSTLTFIGAGVTLISAAAWAAVLGAIFGWRDGR